MENKKEQTEKKETQAYNPPAFFKNCREMVEKCFGAEKEMPDCCAGFFKAGSDQEKGKTKTNV